MGAGDTFAAVYQAEAVCRTPLRTGGAESDLEQVLRDRDGIAFLQGSSLAGALRDWLERGPDRALARPLFGDHARTGHLVVSDAVFDRDADQYTRPRLRIDPACAAGVKNGKFDATHMGRGAKLRFSLVWLGKPEERAELAAVEWMLSAMDAGAIRLGAQKSNGFGQVSLAVKRRLFDLTDPEDRHAWLADEWDGEPLRLAALAPDVGVVFTVVGRADNILVKTAPVVEKLGGMQYTPNLREGERAVLPGSSVKGAVRERTEYIARVLGLDEAFTGRYFGRGARAGDNGLPGQVYFEDAILSDQRRRVSRIRLDRFTGGVQRAGLFTEEPVSTGLRLVISAPEEPALCGLLLCALRDLGLGLYNLGSGWAIGRGQVAVERIEADAPKGRRAALRFDRQGVITLEDPSGLADGWMRALEEARHEH